MRRWRVRLQFTDMTREEFQSKILMPKSAAETFPPQRYAPVPDVSGLPESWDWSTQGAVTPVKGARRSPSPITRLPSPVSHHSSPITHLPSYLCSPSPVSNSISHIHLNTLRLWVSLFTRSADQGSVGSCWAFSTVGNLEGVWYLATKKLTSLSAEFLVDCDDKDCGVFGGWPYLAMEYIESRNGIPSNAAYPYCSGTGDCYPCMANKNRCVLGGPLFPRAGACFRVF